MRRSLLSVLAVLVLAGCGTMTSNSYQMVRVETPGVLGADCKLETPANQYRALTPSSIQVERSHHNLKVVCEKANYHPAMVEIVSHMTAKNFLNFSNGFIPGAIYDAASHSVYSYPDVISVTMEMDETAVEKERKAVMGEPVEPLQLKNPYPPLSNVPAEKSFTQSLKK